MKCPGCEKEMTQWTLEGHQGRQVTTDVCTGCQAFWFDPHESLQLSAGSTLKLMKFIGEHSPAVKPAFPQALRCPRRAARGARSASEIERAERELRELRRSDRSQVQLRLPLLPFAHFDAGHETVAGASGAIEGSSRTQGD